MRATHRGPLPGLGARALLAAGLVLVAGVLPGCTSTVRAGFARGADFTGLRSFAFAEAGVPRVETGSGDAAGLERELGRLIRRGLVAKGYAHGAEQPDFYVAYRLELERRIERVQVPMATYLMSSHDYTPSYLIGGVATEEREVERIRLSVDFFGRRGELIWRGVFQDRRERGFEIGLDEVVEAVLRRFPAPRPRPAPAAPEAEHLARPQAAPIPVS